MSNAKKMLLSAAGNAGGDTVDITDVFSTFLYTGNGASQTIENGIALGGFGRGTSTLFDGGAYLNRTSDLANNADGKTLTLSVWVFPEEDANQMFFQAATSNGSGRVVLSLDDTQKLAFGLWNSSGGLILGLESRLTSGGGLPLKVWSHVLISVDLANTSNRHLYINDAIPSHVDWDTYTDDTVDFTQPKWGIAGSPTSGGDDERMAHLYFDYTFRDLSTASNRRIFIDANGGSTAPSTLAALNPIIYVPMTEDYTIGKNIGTGGDFTANGSPTILQSGTQYEDDYGQGGLVWTKSRTTASAHGLYDTVRGVSKEISSSSAVAQSTDNGVTAFNSNGYTVGNRHTTNTSAANYASWTFRKAPKFFDCVTYTGNGSGNRQISHNLGSTPGMMLIKITSEAGGWAVYHRGNTANPETDKLRLDNTDATSDHDDYWADTAPTSANFTVGSDGDVNQNSATYVAYLFAHNNNDGEFGPDGDQDIIKCGSYTGNGSNTGPVIDLGFEPQWLMFKRTNDVENWIMFDNMRGMSVGEIDPDIRPDLSQAEGAAVNYLEPTATGFKIANANSRTNGNGDTYIYMAIRRGPLAPPEAGTEVFDVAVGLSGSTLPSYNSNFPVDMSLSRRPSSAENWTIRQRLTGKRSLIPNNTDAESTGDAEATWDYMDGWGDWTADTSTHYSWMWKRAPSYCDVVCFSADGTTSKAVPHNLGVIPELVITKTRSTTGEWYTYVNSIWGDASTSDKIGLNLKTNGSASTQTVDGYGTFPTRATDTNFYVGGNANINGETKILYLFASLDGVSKLGTVTHSGSSTDVDCGFSNGARFVLLKRTDATGDWYVWDSARGIIAGNDPYLLLNSTAATVTNTDFIDPLNAGFTISGDFTDGDYIFYAIA